MLKIILVTKPDCLACGIVKRVITTALNDIDSDIAFWAARKNGFIEESLKVDVYPTTIFYRSSKTIEEKANGAFVEIARLEGSFPVEYLNRVIDKFKLENND